jgi:adenosine deaminase
MTPFSLAFSKLVRSLAARVLPLALAAFPATLLSQSANIPASSTHNSREDYGEKNLAVARKNPLALYHFLLGMPKGADLHNHLSGAVYAESWIRAASEDGLCVYLSKLAFVKPAQRSAEPICPEGQVPVASAYKDQHLFDALIDSFSMRGFVPSPGVTGHDHFFDTFEKFGGIDHRHFGEWLDEVATRGASQSEQYLELMHTPDFSHSAGLAMKIGWTDNFAKYRESLLALGLREDIAPATAAFDRAEALRREREHCGQSGETPACRVQIRFLCQVLRGLPREVVFAQTLLCFEAASADHRFVGLNFVMPEDGYVSMSDYTLHMRMLDFFHGLYPKVHISLHAGELAPGLVPYEGLCCHIRQAVELGHAERIGHGVDIMYENEPHALLRELAAKHILVEINLTSNDGILGISGQDHPFSIYKQFNVPLALSTDDEGVSRTNLTHEYVRAVQTFGLTYRDLKQMIRASLEHSFLPGPSLWHSEDIFTRTVAPCSKDARGSDKPSASCSDFLKSSEKGSQQWELERRFLAFESGL